MADHHGFIVQGESASRNELTRLICCPAPNRYPRIYAQVRVKVRAKNEGPRRRRGPFFASSLVPFGQKDRKIVSASHARSRRPAPTRASRAGWFGAGLCPSLFEGIQFELSRARR